ncbi:MAG: trifunctional serine/threonine-protein kinase/ATP-binding protein/sensor histidine kinase, partial [Nostoc sp.]
LMADTKHMLLIGAYRDNEVTPAHPLMLTLSEIQKSQATINTITLAPLSQEQVNQLVGDTLKCTETLASPLSQLIYQKTQGNPFFATQFLKALHQDGLIEFNFESGYWQCDITQVTQQALTDDVVAFMAFQLRKLPQSTQNVLQLAACIGNKFDLATLAIVSESSSIETATCLWKALQEGLILPISDVYKFYQEYGSSEWEKKHENSSEQVAQYKFLHDRVQQAAYSLILDEQKQATHLKIGQLLQENSSEIEREEKLFDIVGHLNLGQGLINQQQEREDLAQLNLKASSKARNSTAYAAAKIYLQNGIELLQSDCWQSQYQLTLKLYIAAAEANYLTGSFEKTQQWTDIILENAKSLLDRIEVYEIQLSICIAQERFTEAIEICLQTLKLLEVNISNFPTDIHVEEAFANITNLLHEQKIEDLFYLPTMTDAYILAAMRFLNLLVVPAYQTSPNLFLLTVVSAIELSIKYGNSSSSATFYSLYGMVLCCISNDIERGYEFGTLALNLLNQLSDKQFHSRTLLFLLAFIKHWKSHPKHSLLLGQSGYQIGLETGDLENTAWNCFHECQTSYLIGQELSELKQKMQARSNVIQQTKHQIQLALNEIQRQAVLNIIGNIENPCYLIGEAFNEEELLPKYQKENSIQVLHCIYLHKLILCFLFGEYSLAVDFSTVAAKYIGGVLGQGIVPVFYYYESLASLAVFFNSSELEQQNTLELIRVNQKKLGEWAHHAPMNHQHKVDLVSAEKCRVLGQKAEAIEFYDKAISGAKENGYIQEEALANELAAKFYLDWGKEKVAQAYIQEAYYCYARWGAKAKVADLERGYPQLLAPILQQTRTAFSVNETVFPLGTVTSTSSSTSIFHSLDLAAILKASQTISSEIELGKLLSSLLRILIENAGANKCVLMLMRDERLLIKGSIIEGSEPIVLQPLPIEDSQDIPLKMIYKVKNNKQTVVLLDATADPTLANDPYIMRQQPYSILCSPILHQGKFLGILYLENNLATRAFTSERVELLNLLCAQAAISIENAQLYQRSLENAQQLERSFAELQQKSEDLQQAQLQIVQSEKMSALGNLVAGVAHEMNNPLGFISASLQQAKPSLADIVKHFKLYEESFPNPGDEIIDHAKEIDLGYTLEDLPKIIDSMVMACDRLENISTSLRTFSRADKDYKVPFNIHEGIDSTILILKHRLKANEQRPAIEVITDYGNFPQVKCFPGQLNQVFMNILANAIDVLDESNTGRTFKEIKDNPNRITIKTSLVNEGVKIAIVDNGKGMSESVKQKIFDHLFTTKAVGKGTGLGLAIARQIIEETHGGKLNFNSVLGEGTEFIITIPL